MSKKAIKRIISDLEAVLAETRPARVIYIANPYSDIDPLTRLYRAQVAGKYLVEQAADGNIPLSTVCQGHTVSDLNTDASTEWEFWRSYNLSLMSVCDEVHVITLPGWENSVGVTAEIDYALANDLVLKRVRYIENTGRFVVKPWGDPV